LDVVLEHLKITTPAEILSSNEVLFEEFIINLAFTMYSEDLENIELEEAKAQGVEYLRFSNQSQTNFVRYHEIDDKRFRSESRIKYFEFNKEQLMMKYLLQLSPLIMDMRTQTLRFYHRSYLEHFIVKGIIKEILDLERYLSASQQNLISNIENCFFNGESVARDSTLIELVGQNILERGIKDQTIYQILLKVVQMSRVSQQINAASSFAISVLNEINFSFSNYDLSQVKIPFANLSKGIFFGTNFQQSTLKSVNFKQSILKLSNFTDTDLENTDFDYQP
jgi:uncharacterized protein YjbI with pentapeptide repeats